MCVGTYLGSLVLSETLSYSYQNIFFTRQNWLFTLAIKLILKKQEKNMPLNWHFFNFIFIGCFFFSELFVFLVYMKFAILFKVSKSKKTIQKLSKFKFLIIVFFLARMNFFTCENNVRLYTIWNYCVRLGQIVSYLTQLDPIGPHWTTLGLTRPNWTKLGQIGPNWPN